MSAIATLGEAHDLGWRLTVHCSWGKLVGTKSIRECQATAELDLATLIRTRGGAFLIGGSSLAAQVGPLRQSTGPRPLPAAERFYAGARCGVVSDANHFNGLDEKD